MRGSRGGGSGGSGPPLEFVKLNIADITGNEKITYFSYLCPSIVIRQGWTPLEKFSGSAPDECTRPRFKIRKKSITCII